MRLIGVKGSDQKMDLTVTGEVGKLPYSDAHIAAYPVEYIAGIDLYLAFTAGPGDCGFSHAGALLALLGG